MMKVIQNSKYHALLSEMKALIKQLRDENTLCDEKTF